MRGTIARDVIDTHALVWFFGDSPRLSRSVRAALQDPDGLFALPAIALAEACWIAEHGRVALSVDEILAAVEDDPRIEVVSLDRAVVERSHRLKGIPEMHDRQIVATALLLVDRGETVRILTHDEAIRDSGLAPVLW